MILLPVLRTSTDDKGQDPLRQLGVIRAWAERERATLLEAAVDEGTSALKTNPFERPKFVEAAARAKASGADGVVVEQVDRFTRQGTDEYGWAVVELRRRYGLRLFVADSSLDQQGTAAGTIVKAVHAASAHEWAVSHGKKVKSGMAGKKAKGARFGRPPKLTPEEIARARELRAEGKGFRRIAHALSTDRGAFRVADSERRRQLEVSHTLVMRVLRGAE